MKKENQMSKQNDIEALFPWYVTGKLSDADHQLVEDYLEKHPQSRFQLELIKSEYDETVDINQQIDVPTAGSLDRLMTSLDAEFGPQAPKSDSWWQSAINSFSDAFQMPMVRYAGLAAVVVIALQSVSIISLINSSPPSGNGYETASGTTTLAPGTDLLISFNPTATAGKIAALLEKYDGSIIKGPISGGIYQIHFTLKKPTPEKISTLVTQLQNHRGIIEFVAPQE
jgi:hypothetical protein